VTRRVILVFWAVAAAAAFTLKALAPGLPLFHDLLTDGVMLRIGGGTKLLLLLVGWHFAARNAAALEANNPARGPWRLFAWGLLAFASGQGVLSSYQVVLGSSPYPSIGDAFFLCAYPLLIAATFGFVRAYREAGYPVGSAREHAALAVVMGVTFAVVGYRLLRPVMAMDSPLSERLLTAGYPALDFVWLVAILVLLRIAAGFRGGQVFRAWVYLFVGTISQCAGDILYAYFAILGQTGLDAVIDATYIVGYLCVALGTMGHNDLLK
jgi:hypothetical protein